MQNHHGEKWNAENWSAEKWSAYNICGRCKEKSDKEKEVQKREFQLNTLRAGKTSLFISLHG